MTDPHQAQNLQNILVLSVGHQSQGQLPSPWSGWPEDHLYRIHVTNDEIHHGSGPRTDRVATSVREAVMEARRSGPEVIVMELNGSAYKARDQADLALGHLAGLHLVVHLSAKWVEDRKAATAVSQLHADRWIDKHLQRSITQTTTTNELSRVLYDKYGQPFEALSDGSESLHKILAGVRRNTTTVSPVVVQAFERKLSRTDHASIDETAIIAELVDGREGVMIDVGAHHGAAMRPFVERGWTVYAFEPDQMNREVLTRRFGNHSNVFIDSRAVSDVADKEVTFYRSDVSSGISGLHAFHESHRPAQKVTTTTLSVLCHQRQLSDVDFLKIDAEGHDLFVLDGYDWGREPPDVVECEFEDKKTVPLGYDFNDLATRLTGLGYDVWVSEWHPVVQYGVVHDWRGLSHYPCQLENNAWGNLLAFRNPPTVASLEQAVAKTIMTRPGGGPVRQPTTHPTSKLDEPTTVGGPRANNRIYTPSPRPTSLASIAAEIRDAYKGTLAIPAASAVAAHMAAVVAAGTRHRLLTQLFGSVGNAATLVAIGMAVARLRRERNAAGSRLEQTSAEVAQANLRIARAAAATAAQKLEHAYTELSQQVDEVVNDVAHTHKIGQNTHDLLQARISSLEKVTGLVAGANASRYQPFAQRLSDDDVGS